MTAYTDEVKIDGPISRNPYAPWWRLALCAVLRSHRWEWVYRQLQHPNEYEAWLWCSRCWAKVV